MLAFSAVEHQAIDLLALGLKGTTAPLCIVEICFVLNIVALLDHAAAVWPAGLVAMGLMAAQAPV
jgi:hypothetical protein